MSVIARLVMMERPPGSGKSTLAESVARTLGPRVDLVRDIDIFEREEFAEALSSLDAVGPRPTT